MRPDFESSGGIAARLSLVLIAAAGAAGGCAAPTPSVDAPRDGVAPMGLAGAPLFPARLDGQEVDVLLDTGAPVSLIDAALASRLGLEVRSRWIPRAYRFKRGTQHARRYAPIERLELAGLAVGALELPLVDLEAGAGLTIGSVVRPGRRARADA